METKNNTKIAFFLSSFRAGGGERVTVDLANGFAERGYSVDLLVMKPVGPYKEQVNPKVNLISVDAGRIIFSLPKVIDYFRKTPPEVIVAIDEYTHLMALAGRWRTGAKTRVILRMGNMMPELFKRYGGKSKFLPVLVRRFYKYADGVIANSKGVRDSIIEVTGIDEKRVSVIFNPKLLPVIHSLMKEEVSYDWLTKKTLPVAVAVCRLREQKNLEFLIRAFAKASSVVPSRLIIVGAGRDGVRLQEMTREISADDRVSFAGYQENPYAFMAKSDIFVSASLWEGLPNAVIEALVCGMPVISSDCDSGPREILAPDTDYRGRLKKGLEYAQYGVLTAVNDEDALVSALTKMLTDSALRQKYSDLAKDRMLVFDFPKILDEYAKEMGI